MEVRGRLASASRAWWMQRPRKRNKAACMAMVGFDSDAHVRIRMLFALHGRLGDRGVGVEFAKKFRAPTPNTQATEVEVSDTPPHR
mmetsp:Transcript_39110/g.90108  ORF Transcript_39110/g.90108 Transcript_39110/m.90108 type:complete len:86 (+) Transcript_39110:346-603(+)